MGHGAGDRMGAVERFPEWQIWSKKLPAAKGESRVAVLVINLSKKQQDVTLDFAALKLGKKVEAVNVWTGEPEPMGHGRTEFKGMQPHDGKFLVLRELALQ